MMVKFEFTAGGGGGGGEAKVLPGCIGLNLYLGHIITKLGSVIFSGLGLIHIVGNNILAIGHRSIPSL